MILEVGLHTNYDSESPFVKKQDRFLIDHKQQLFGVFDGVGAYQDSGQAAETAKQTIQRSLLEPSKYFSIEPPDRLDLLKMTIIEANKAINENVHGATTATIVNIVDDILYWVSVGDSRLYIKPNKEELSQVSQDEGEGNILNNWLGTSGGGDYFKGVSQAGIFKLEADDKIVLVSDGITGDFGDDILTLEEVDNVIGAGSAQLAAEALVRVSRKHDDKTAIVIFTKKVGYGETAY